MINNKPSSEQTSWQDRLSCRLFSLLYTTAIVEAVVQYTLQRFPEEASLWECLPRIEQLFWNRWLSLLPFWSFACPPKQSQKTLRVTFVPRFPIVSGVGNLSVVSVINSSHSKTPHIMDLVRRLRYLSMQHNFIVRAHHVPGVSNAIADALSKFQMQHFRVLSPDADQSPCTILPSLMTLWERKSCGTLPGVLLRTKIGPATLGKNGFYNFALWIVSSAQPGMLPASEGTLIYFASYPARTVQHNTNI